ncbi:MAG: hypothetical protein IJ593_05230 [Lachnospiraceae bacterium]|nr:hypothetical protein [Lachnospiraceae bacterium]
MREQVEFIFKTLIKVPIIILVSYLVFNLFAFGISYFKVLGYSYIVSQTIVENNFLPDAEGIILANYADSLETNMLANVSIVDDGNAIEGSSILTKSQYGVAKKFKVQAQYVWIFPLVNTNVETGNGAYGLEYSENPNCNIHFEFTVPGLKYYPDLS